MCYILLRPIDKNGVARANPIVSADIRVATILSASVGKSFLGSYFSSRTLFTIFGVRYSPNIPLLKAFPSPKSRLTKQGIVPYDTHIKFEKVSCISNRVPLALMTFHSVILFLSNSAEPKNPF
jgi:hypothetical protein